MPTAPRETTATAPYLQVRGLEKSYGATPVFADVSFKVERGEFVCLLGPSGCGKTTLLLCLAGLEQPSAGTLHKDGADITRQPAAARDVGIVFQSYALFPSLTVADNIAFGLVNARRPRADIDKRVAELLQLFSLESQRARYPAQLSGGQQQRVALARALAVSPSLLLLDEPLSALDAQVRTRLRQEIREVQRSLGLTTLMVTHDQEEAQTMADRIVVMHQGRIQQIGTPWEVYNEPRTAFVADFIGVSNNLAGVVSGDGTVDLGGLLLRCDVAGIPTGQRVQCVMRPEEVRVEAADSGEIATTDQTRFMADVYKIEYLGAITRLHVRALAHPGLALRADLPKHAFQAVAFQPGRRVAVTLPSHDVRAFAC